MSRQESLICVSCPMGCHLDIEIPEKGEWLITGNQCKHGIAYAKAELTNPTRVLTSTVRVNNGFLNRVPVRTSDAIPKPLLFDAMHVINGISLEAPVRIGDVIIPNLLNTGVDVLASRSMEVKQALIRSKKHQIDNKPHQLN